MREVGGAMAPLWNQYYKNITKIIYVVDASNLCQIAAAGVLLYTVLAEPQLKHAKVSKYFQSGVILSSNSFFVMYSFCLFPGAISFK